MINITLPDGSVRSYERGTTALEIAKSISEGLARNVLSAKFNNNTIEVSEPLQEDGSLRLFTWNDKEGFELGGAGVNTTEDGKARGVIGLDDTNGEALHLVALEDGTKALVIKSEKGVLLFGMSEKNGSLFQNETEFAGTKYVDSNGELLWSQEMNTKQREDK